MEAAKVLQIQVLNENRKPVPDHYEDYKDLITSDEVNLERELDLVNHDSETSVGEFSPQFYNEQQEQPRYLETQKSYFDRNNDGKYSCDECDFQTKNVSNLRIHKTGKHDGIKFECDQCDRQFSTKTNLQTHKYSKHEGKRYSCEQCKFESSHPASLSQHKAKMHKYL